MKNMITLYIWLMFIAAILGAVGLIGYRIETGKKQAEDKKETQLDRDNKHKEAQLDRDKKHEETGEDRNAKFEKGQENGNAKFNEAKKDRDNKHNDLTKRLDAIDDNINKIVCDRDKTLGCNIPFSSSNSQTWNDGSKMRTSTSIAMKIGGERKQYTILTTEDHNKDHPQDNEINFPSIEGKEFSPPFNLTKSKDKLNFTGKIFDYKTEELVGWFDGDEFGVVKPCAFSWNKDSKAVEILDRYDNVVFSMEQSIGGGFRYRGFFKIDETFYVIGDEITVTNDSSLAKRKIKEIKRVFDHYGSNSLGKRIPTDGKFELF